MRYGKRRRAVRSADGTAPGNHCTECFSQLDEPKYGYSLVTTLTEYGMPVETNTLYPLLRRLEGQGLLISEWNTEESKPRKYYCITPEGKEVYEKLKKQWHKTAASMEQLLEGKGEEGIK